MILVNFNIHNPWSDTWIILWTKSGSFTKHKAWEFNGYQTSRIIDIEFNLKPRGDHAGARIMLGLFGYDVELHFYDVRHWNYDTNTWETYN
jgi:hypothetical protein